MNFKYDYEQTKNGIQVFFHGFFDDGSYVRFSEKYFKIVREGFGSIYGMELKPEDKHLACRIALKSFFKYYMK